MLELDDEGAGHVPGGHAELLVDPEKRDVMNFEHFTE